MAIVAAVRAASKNERWGFLTFEGIVGIVAGIIAMALPGLTVLVFVGLLAAWALVSGVLELRAASNLATDHGRWWLALGGIISILFGIVLVTAPVFGALVVTWWVGAYATLFGASLLALAFQLGSVGLIGNGGSAQGAKRIDAQTKPKKPFSFIPHSAAGSFNNSAAGLFNMFNRYVALALAGLMSGVMAMTYDDLNSWHDAYDRYHNTVWHRPALPYARFAFFVGIIFSAIAIRSFLHIKPRSKLPLVGALILGCLSGLFLYITYTAHTFTK
ncbi:MAG: HdeD family acid-resistance protein [Pseudomonadota bacterium]|nr:HdeD family acid-resistance protein [Pseudomonadota bacterium]